MMDPWETNRYQTTPYHSHSGATKAMLPALVAGNSWLMPCTKDMTLPDLRKKSAVIVRACQTKTMPKTTW